MVSNSGRKYQIGVSTRLKMTYYFFIKLNCLSTYISDTFRSLYTKVRFIKNVQLFSWEPSFLYILQTLVLLDHVYSDCLQNVATNTKK